MGLFRRKNTDFIDLGERHRKQQERAENLRSEMTPQAKESVSSSENNSGGFGFFGAIANTVSSSNSVPKYEGNDSGYVDVSSGVDEKRRKLAKRLMEMTNKIEELSNQIYHLQQRIEVLEKKGGVSGY